MDEDNNPIIKNTGDINIDTTTYFQQETQNITQNGDYIYEQNENGAWHLELKPQDSTEPTDVNINISSPPVEFEQSNITNNGYYLMNKNSTTNKYEPIQSTSSNYDLNINVNSKINIKYISNSSSSPNNLIAIKDTNWVTGGSQNVTVPANSLLITIIPKEQTDDTNETFQIFCSGNSSYTETIGSGRYYYILSGRNLYLFDENENNFLYINISSALRYESFYFNKNNFNLIFD